MREIVTFDFLSDMGIFKRAGNTVERHFDDKYGGNTMKKKRGLLTKELKKKLRKSRNDSEILANLAAASNELDDDDLFLVSGGTDYDDGPPKTDSEELIQESSNEDIPFDIFTQAAAGNSNNLSVGGSVPNGTSNTNFIFGGSQNNISNINNSSSISQDAVNSTNNYLMNDDGTTIDPSDRQYDGQLDGTFNSFVFGENQEYTGNYNDLNDLNEFNTNQNGELNLNNLARQNNQVSVQAGDGFTKLILKDAEIKI